MPEEGLYQIGVDPYVMYTGRQGFEDFQNVLEEHVAEMSFQEGDSEPRRINPPPFPDGTLRWNQVEQRTEVYNHGSVSWIPIQDANSITQVTPDNSDEITVNVNGTNYWYNVREEEALRNWESDRRRYVENTVLGGGIGRMNSSVVGIAEMNSLNNPHEGDRCHVHENGTTYIYDGNNWIAQVNPSMVELMRDNQQELNQLHYQAAVKLANAKKFSEKYHESKEEVKEGGFLDFF